MGSKRKSRENLDKTKINTLKPLDILSLGTEDDPCFGKHHSLKAEECIMCGDSEFCSIVMSQNMHKTRLEFEANQKMKDLDEAEEDMIKKTKQAKELIADLIDLGVKRTKIILKVSDKYKITKDKVKEIYNQF